MLSGDEYKNDCLNLLTEFNFEQVFDFRNLTGNVKQLDTFLVNKPQLWIESNIDKNLDNPYKIGNAKTITHSKRNSFSLSTNQKKKIGEICSKQS